MRSTGFIFFSIIIHSICVMAVALMPIKTVSDKSGEPIEVNLTEAAEKAGAPEAPPSPEPSKPEVIEVAKPIPPAPPAPVATPTPKPVAKKIAKKAPAAKKVAPVAVPTPVENDESPDVAQTEEAPAPQEELVPVKESAPGGVQAMTSEEETTPAPTPAPTPKAVAVSQTPQETGALVKGGAAQEGAVSYLDLRQMPGNKSPVYPINARMEKRQGQLELMYRVTQEGKVADIQVAQSSGHQDLDREAVRAIAQFKFVPGQEGWARHPVNFALKGQAVALPSQLRSKDAQAD